MQIKKEFVSVWIKVDQFNIQSISLQHSSLPTGVIAMGVTAESVFQLCWTHRALEQPVG